MWNDDKLKKKYPKYKKKQRETWLDTYNKSELENEEDKVKQAEDSVTEAFVRALAIIDEAGKMISAANMSKLTTAITSMQSAIEALNPLIAEETETIEEAKILAQDDSWDSKRYAVACALKKRAIADAMTAKVNDGNYDPYDYYDYGSMPYIRDLYDDYVVYSMGGELYQCTYTISSDEVTLGDSTPVKISYVPTSESMTERLEVTFTGVSPEDVVSAIERSKKLRTIFNIPEKKTESSIEIKGELIKLEEKAVKGDEAKICLITPGWGSSGYYSEEMLKRDGPTAFPKGTHMYMNHPTEQEDRDRPERDVRDLAGVIDSDPVYENGFAGPGLYANAKVFPNYRDFIDEAAAHIGVSIRAGGTAIEGEAEGRHGLLVNSLTEGYSVDYVTVAGRGGQVLSLYESARKKLDSNVVVTENSGRINVEITQEEFNKLKESADKAAGLEGKLTETNTVLNTLRKSLIASNARNIVNEALASIPMAQVIRERVRDLVLKGIPLTESGDLDEAKLIEKAKEDAASEIKYIEAVSGNVTGGQVVGLGESKSTELNAEEVDKALNEAFKTLGMSDKEAELAVRG